VHIRFALKLQRLRFRHFGKKMPIHAAFLEVLGNSTSKWGVIVNYAKAFTTVQPAVYGLCYCVVFDDRVRPPSSLTCVKPFQA